MIEKLKEYPKTFKKFEEYMERFDNDDYFFTSEKIYCNDFSMKIPQQFLIGCLMGFISKHKIIYVTITSDPYRVSTISDLECDNYQHFRSQESMLVRSFEILEENYLINPEFVKMRIEDKL